MPSKFTPLLAVGIIGQITGDQNIQGRGSCFAYGNPEHIVTAAHCVAGTDVQRLVVLDAVQVRAEVSEIQIHPEADLALLRVRWPENSFMDAFWGYVPNVSLGQDFFAFGYPEDIFGPERNKPTPRLFKGHFQRFIDDYEDHFGHRYSAIELNIPAPPGLSGGPVFVPTAHRTVIGVVTENWRSRSVLESSETQTAHGITKILYEEVVNYGVALRLDAVAPWLREQFGEIADAFVMPFYLEDSP